MRSQKFSAADHLYLQVAGALEKMIDEEILKIGDKLPSVRVLSEKNGISMGTAFQAYYHLEGKGLIEITIQQDKKIFIDVTDNGKGISRENIRQVFNPGFTTKKRGWGLGLTLCKRIIEQYHQGELFVKQSEVGKGTTFRVVI